MSHVWRVSSMSKPCLPRVPAASLTVAASALGMYLLVWHFQHQQLSVLQGAFALLLVAVVAATEHLVATLSRRRLDLDKMPSPPFGTKAGLVLGHVPELMVADYHTQLLEWAEQYGGCYRVRLPGKEWVIVSDPVIAARVNNRGDDFICQRSHEYSVFDQSMGGVHGLHSSFGTTDEEHWRNVRKATGPAFSVANLRAYHAAIAPLFDALMQDVAAEQRLHGSVELERRLLDMQARAAVQVLLGCNWAGMKARWPTIIEDVDVVLTELDQRVKNPLRLAWSQTPVAPLLSKRMRAFNAALARVHALYLEIAEDIRARPTPAGGDSSLSACLWRLANTATGKLFTAKELVPHVGLYFIAAFETSSSTIGWLCYCAAHYPHHQEALFNELKVAGFAGPGAKPLAYEDLSRLPAATAFINECMRRYPVAATSGVRRTTRPTRLGPYMLPANTLVACQVYSIQNSRANWGDDALDFKPERWADAHAAFVRGSKGVRRFTPFGDGPKNCVGQAFGLMIVRGIFLRLVCRFDIALHPSMPPHEDLALITRVALTTKLTQLRLVLKERQ